MKIHRNLVAGILILIFMLSVPSCSLPGSHPMPPVTATIDINATLEDIARRETALVISTASVLPSESPISAIPTDLPTFTLQPTETFIPTDTSTTIPTIADTPTPVPSETAQPTATVPSLTPDSPQKTATRQAELSSANILIYEDVVQEQSLIPRIDNALSGLGMSGENIINVRDAAGDFLFYLESGTAWDLIIFSQESRRQIEPGIMGELLSHVKNNGALILEGWNLDQYAHGSTLELLNYCGIEIQHDYYRSNNYDFVDFYIYDFKTGSPVLSYPNQISFPLKPSPYWKADVGDVVRLTQASDAMLLAGIWTGDPTTYGLAASCLDGRVIIQTFSSHDYYVNDTNALYQNYIVNTLMSHFISVE